MKIKKGDNILVIAGKDRGRQGVIEKVLVKDGKVVVTGINMAKRSLKPSRKNPHGGIINLPAPINASNVQIVCPHCGKAVRVAYKVSEKAKERICRKCQGNLDAKIDIAKEKPKKDKNVKA